MAVVSCSIVSCQPTVPAIHRSACGQTIQSFYPVAASISVICIFPNQVHKLQANPKTLMKMKLSGEAMRVDQFSAEV